jgi:hypothetical protein
MMEIEEPQWGKVVELLKRTFPEVYRVKEEVFLESASIMNDADYSDPFYQGLDIKSFQENDGAHYLFCMGFAPYVIDLLRACQAIPTIDKEKHLKDIFNFAEHLANAKDERVECLIEQSFIEDLMSEKDIRDFSKRFMGAKCQALAQAVLESWENKRGYRHPFVNEKDIDRYIVWNKKKNTKILGKRKLTIKLDDLKKKLGIPEDHSDPQLRDDYDLNTKLLKKLEAHIEGKIRIDTRIYEYTLRSEVIDPYPIIRTY